MRGYSEVCHKLLSKSRDYLLGPKSLKDNIEVANKDQPTGFFGDITEDILWGSIEFWALWINLFVQVFTTLPDGYLLISLRVC